MTAKGKKQVNWTTEEKENFKHDWQFLNKDEILEKYKRPYKALTTYARLLGVKKAFSQRKYKLLKLIEECNTSYYWLGFILADGCFAEHSLRVTLANLDVEHLTKLAKYINANIHIGPKYSNIAVRDPYTIGIIQQKFGLVNRKTYHGANFNITNKEFFFSFLAGLIDGDGCFCKQSNNKVNMIRIHCHSSYAEFYQKISNQLKEYGIESRVYFCSRGYVKFVISKQQYFLMLDKYVRDCNIPILERKWSKLNNIKL
jgi:hypothetical protein